MICDICMPVMSGPELYQMVEQRFPEQPVLFISACPDEYLQRGCTIVTEQRLLRKPFGSAELIERVGQVLLKKGLDPGKYSEEECFFNG